ncbi:TPA: 30S ribosomal protein S27e [Candidatus Bathyarchaeota archaeon]|nr:30S ribosomal protein S27e [Candidatus Bathyarchaeota archaeon]
MPRRKDVLPQPRSRFLEVKCPKCGNVQVIFDRAATIVKCRICYEQLAQPRGGKARILGEIVRVLS